MWADFSPSRDAYAGYSRMRPGRLVGREAELAALHEGGLRPALAGAGCLYLVGGEAGVGKTSLAESLCEGASKLGAMVAWGRCWEAGGAPPFWPWVQVIRACLGSDDRPTLGKQFGPHQAYLAQVVPELAGTVPGESPPVTGEGSRFALFESVAWLLRRSAAAQPLVVVLDDLHAADEASLLLLHFIARSVRDARVLLVGTYREPEGPLAGTVGELLAELARQGTRVSLRGLPREHVAQLVEELGGMAPSAVLVGAVYDATGGNPFFIDELMRLMVAEGTLGEVSGSAAVGLPEGVRHVIMRRVGLLSEETKELLGIGAVVGREFTLGLVAEVLGDPREALIGALEEASRAQLVREVSLTVGRYAFTHGLIRESLYASLPVSRRLELHRAVGEALERLYRDAPEPHLAELAHHFIAAGALGDPGKVIGYCARAATRAMSQLAHEEAIGHLERALEAIDLLPDGEEEQRRLQLLLDLGRARRLAGNRPGQRAAYLEAAGVSRRLGWSEGLARAALGLGTGQMAMSYFEVDELLRTHLEEALVAIGPQDSPLRVLLLARLGAELLYSPSPERAEQLTAEAVEMARRLGDERALAAALEQRGRMIVGRARPSARIVLDEEALAAAQAAGERELELWARVRLAVDRAELGELDAMAAEERTIQRLAEHFGLAAFRYHPVLWGALRAIAEGRFDDAERLVGEALEIGRPFHGEMAELLFSAQLHALRWEQGRLEEIIPIVEAAVVERPRLLPWLGLDYAELGRRDDAAVQFERFAATGFAVPRDYFWPAALTAFAVTCARLEDRERAPGLYELLRPFDDRFMLQGGVVGVLGPPGAMLLGRLAALMGYDEEAERHFNRAVELCRRAGVRALLAWTQLEFGRCLLERSGDAEHERAVKILEAARSEAQALGMAGVRAEAQELIERLAAAPEAVFRDEGDFWLLAYRGRQMRLKSSRGLQYIALLLSRPNVEIRALDVLGANAPGGAAAVSEAEAHDAGLTPGNGEATDPVLDPRARRAYQQRLAEVQAELEQANRFHDPERAARAREELDFVASELAAATGARGRTRNMSGAAERARVSVTKAIREAIARIDSEDSALAEYLRATIRTGGSCCYRAGATPLSWQL